jgi:3-isopropylmalate/(R)-2-methylmalate dehydratase large subunit
MGATMAEKILARASGQAHVRPGQIVTAQVDVAMGHDLSFPVAYRAMRAEGVERVWDPDRIVVVLDHNVPATSIRIAETHVYIRRAVQEQALPHFYEAGRGICHQVLPEEGHALPGRLIVGGDSHTTTYGAFGAAACGIGTSDLAYVLGMGNLWFRVPETIRIELTGRLAAGVTSKDVILKLLGIHTAELAQYRAIEYVGDGAAALDIPERMTISNMGVEIGAKFAFFPADARTVAWLQPRTRVPVAPFGPDADASYAESYHLALDALEPQVARPHNTDNVVSVTDIGTVPVQQAFLGSCTNARAEDLEKAAAILKGRKVHPGTRLLVIPASQQVQGDIARSGALTTLIEAGAMVAPPGCGPCGGGHLGVLGPGETAISASNRNFKGRMGSTESFVYLGSPETVAASAIEGRIADPRKYLR